MRETTGRPHEPNKLEPLDEDSASGFCNTSSFDIKVDLSLEGIALALPQKS